MIKLRHQQPSIWTGILKEDLDPLWEPWMRAADAVLEDEALVDQVYEAPRDGVIRRVAAGDASKPQPK